VRKVHVMGSGVSVSLEEAIQRNKPSEVERIVRRKACEVDTRDNDGQTALMKVCRDGQTEIASILLKVGAKPNMYLHKNGGGNSLHFASIGKSTCLHHYHNFTFT
jgi:ankyrin repeat protein